MSNYLSVKLTRPHEKPPLRVVFRSIFSILIWAILIPLLVQFLHHEVKPIFAKGLESGFLSKPFYKSGTYGIIRFDKSSSVPRLRELFVSVSPERPHLRAVIRPVDTGGDIAIPLFLLLLSQLIFMLFPAFTSSE